MVSRGDIVDHLLGRKILLSHSLISYLDEEYIYLVDLTTVTLYSEDDGKYSKHATYNYVCSNSISRGHE
jgi:hypothetical protein